MKHLLLVSIISWLTFSYNNIFAQSETDASELDRTTTLDVVSWNLEWFGAPDKSSDASSYSEQLEAVSNEIINLDADVYALQEVVVDDLNGDFFTPLLESLNEGLETDRYIGFLSDRYSYYFSSPTTTYPAQRICFIVDTKSVSVVDTFPLFKDVYNGYSTSDIDGYGGDAVKFWAGGRLPYLMNAIVTVDGVSEQIDFINIHAKCCSDSEKRRQYDAEYLYQYALTTTYSNNNVIILGDYNDDMVSGNPYESWYADSNEEYTLAASNDIDHISLSDELEDEYSDLSNNVEINDVSISDHDPVLLRLLLNSSKKEQVVDLDNISDQKPEATVTLNAETSSGLDPEYQLIEGDAELDGNTLICNGEGNVLVRAYQTGNSEYAPAFSDIVSFNVSSSTGVNEAMENKLSITPNPADDVVNINIGDELYGGRVDIYNISGSLVKTFYCEGSDVLSVSDLSNGIYFITFSSKSVKITQRLLIKH